MDQNMEGIIKTTARIQDTDKPLIQTPLRTSQREYQGDRSLVSNTNSSHTETSGNRNELDNGVDNPFKPGSDICREAQPIVDFYKSGLNHSRAQSPVFPGLQTGLYEDNDTKLIGNGESHNISEIADTKKKTCCRSCCVIS